ncbi:MAG: ABC transporter substrate-binding protein [Bacteroidales bacterium]
MIFHFIPAMTFSKLFPAAFIFLIMFSACAQRNFKDTGMSVFRYNESAGLTSLDPAFARDQANIWATNQIFNGLVQLVENLKVKPCIAKNWEISGDGLIYTFHLRTDVQFHADPAFGKDKIRKVNASDFVYSFNRLIDKKLASPGAWVLEKVSKGENAFSAPNDSTFIIRLSSPFPPFLGLLSMQYCSVVPHEAIEKYGSDFRQHPVGTGPFRFGMWKEGVKLVLLKNDHYFESGKDGPLPYLDAVAVTFIIEKQSAFLEFIKGNLDFLSGIDASYKDELLTNKGELRSKYASSVNLSKQPYLNTEYLGILIDTNFDAAAKSPLRNRLIRQAISYGFDRVKMMRYLRNNIGKPGLAGFVPAGIPWFDQEKVEGYSYNPMKAMQLLEKAGYPGAKGLPPITLTTNASYLDLCRYIQSQLGEIGIIVKIDVTPPATLREMIAQSKVSFFRGSWIADYPDAENYLSLFYSPNFCPAGPNYTHFKSTMFDKLYNESSRQTNDSVRGLTYMQMDRLLMQEAPAIILYYDEVLRFTRKNISGLGSNPLNLLTLKQVKKVK